MNETNSPPKHEEADGVHEAGKRHERDCEQDAPDVGAAHCESLRAGERWPCGVSA